jgi:UDPglucose--hexose-1-phosphate uridylyltransferase
MNLELAVNDLPHRRYNPLTREWILVSPHRTKRPWKGKVEAVSTTKRPAHDASCQLCPRNERAGGERNPDYTGTYVFPNDFAAILKTSFEESSTANGLFRSEPAHGTCRVICFSPRHDLTLPEMPVTDIEKVVQLWADQFDELSKTHRWVQIFENKGEVMGCSNPHPHGQIWASNFLPTEPAKEDDAQRHYLQKEKGLLLLDYVNAEMKDGSRIVVANDHWAALVPYWATWPYETILLPLHRQIRQLTDLSAVEKTALAEILKRLLTRYDNLFQTSFPYSMGWHGAPSGTGNFDHWQLHAHFYPPLLRSATIQKFMVGYEMMAEAQRDLTPEQAAEKLRNLPETHYKESL